MLKLRLYCIFAAWTLSSCTLQTTDASTALMLSDDHADAATHAQCHIEQMNYIKQKIGDDALSFSASQLLDRMFAGGDDFFDGLVKCE